MYRRFFSLKNKGNMSFWKKSFTKMLTLDDARPPGHRYFKGQIFFREKPV